MITIDEIEYCTFCTRIAVHEDPDGIKYCQSCHIMLGEAPKDIYDDFEPELDDIGWKD